MHTRTPASWGLIAIAFSLIVSLQMNDFARHHTQPHDRWRTRDLQGFDAVAAYVVEASPQLMVIGFRDPALPQIPADERERKRARDCGSLPSANQSCEPLESRCYTILSTTILRSNNFYRLAIPFGSTPYSGSFLGECPGLPHKMTKCLSPNALKGVECKAMPSRFSSVKQWYFASINKVLQITIKKK